MYRKQMFVGSIFLLSLLVITSVAQAIFVCNKGSASLNAPEQVRARGEQDIIEGGVALLSAFSSTNNFFSNVEASAQLGKVKLASAKVSGQQAIKYLRVAEDKYTDLVNMFNKYGTTAEASGKLRHFDYATLAKEDQMEDSQVWNQVVERAQTGHVQLLFKYMYDQIHGLRVQLEPVVDTVSKGQTPQVEAYMKVMSQWTDLTSFGQYAAVVFKKI